MASLFDRCVGPATVEFLEGRTLLSMQWEGDWVIRGVAYDVTASSRGSITRELATLNVVITSAGAGQYQLQMPDVIDAPSEVTLIEDGNTLVADGDGGEVGRYLRVQRLADNVISVFRGTLEYKNGLATIDSGDCFGGMGTRKNTRSSFGTFSFVGTRTFSAFTLESSITNDNRYYVSRMGRDSGKVTLTSLSDGAYRLRAEDGSTEVFRRDPLSSSQLVSTSSTREPGSGNYLKSIITLMRGPDGRLLFSRASGEFNASATRRDGWGNRIDVGQPVDISMEAGYSSSSNFAPVGHGGFGLRVSTIREDDRSSAGTSVAELLASAGTDCLTDANTSGREGIAVVAKAAGVGVWQYSTNGGASWMNMPGVSNTAALLLASDAAGLNRVRLVPKTNFAGTVTAALGFRGWDQSRGQNGSQVSTAVNGGSSAFSSAVLTATIRVTSVNDRPLLRGVPLTTSPRFVEGGSSVYVMPSATVSDVDSASLRGASVRIAEGYAAGDQLLFRNTTAITGSFDAATGTLTLTGSAPLASYQAALRTIRYRSVSQAPGDGQRVLVASVRDAAIDSTAREQVVRVSPVNDAPSLAAGSVTFQLASVAEVLELDFATLQEAVGAVTTYSDLDDEEEALGFQLTTLAGPLSKGGVVSATGRVVLMPGDVDLVTWQPSAAGTVKALQLRIWDGRLASSSMVDVYVEVAEV